MSVISNGDARALADQITSELRGEFNILDPKFSLAQGKMAQSSRVEEVIYREIVRFFNG